MTDQRTSVCAYMPVELACELRRLSRSQWDAVQELRLRAQAPLTISTAQGDIHLGVTVSAAQVRDCFVRFCSQAVHTHQEELRQGFVTTCDGLRVGVAGTAVVRDGTVVSYRDITALCVRIPRVVTGCAAPLMQAVQGADGLRGLLLCGAPASGKTTLLRDLAAQLSRRYRIAVIDERCELSLGGLPYCDVLRGCPKATGMLQAVRTLAPDAVIADEIGSDEEWRAVSQSVFCGVPVIASVHGTERRELLARRAVREVLENGGFSQLAFLPPRRRRGAPIVIQRVGELFEDRGDRADRVCVCGSGCAGGTAAG